MKPALRLLGLSCTRRVPFHTSSFLPKGIVSKPIINKPVLEHNFVRFNQTTTTNKNDRPILHLIEAGQIEDAMNMMDVLADAKSPVSADVYGKLFRILADEITDASVFGNLSIKYLKQMNDNGYTPSKEIYDTMIDGFGKSGHFYAMDKIISMMESRNVHLDLTSWNIILNNYGNRNELEEMIKTFNEMKTKFSLNVTTYNLMIRYLGGKANIDAARNYYSELVNSGIKPNIDTFHYILYAITQGAKFDKTPTTSLIPEYFEEMKKFGIEPDSLCMAYMAALHAASADITKLQTAVEKVKSLKGKDTEAYNIVLASFYLTLQFDSLLQTYKYMKNKSISPNVTTYEILFRACADNSRPDLITGYWDDMENYAVMSEDLLHLTFDLYLKCQDIESAINALFRMNAYGVVPSHDMFIKVLKTHRRPKEVADWIEKLSTSEKLDKEEFRAFRKFIEKVVLSNKNR